jgi:uncharacterized lipoprotein NlpE involved in copper resistance
MQTAKQQLKQRLSFIFFFALCFIGAQAWAETEHAGHAKNEDRSAEWHGVYYGLGPCDDCLGLKMTLSLNQKQNYLIVLQYARPGSREIYEKGKYLWDDTSRSVELTPRKGKGIPRKYLIQDENALVELDENGKPLTGSDPERYILRRSDTVKNREIHFH